MWQARPARTGRQFGGDAYGIWNAFVGNWGSKADRCKLRHRHFGSREGNRGRAAVFLKDDDDDALLFEKLQEHVLEKYPNPEGIGCIDHTTLKAWVYTPEKLDLSDPKYLHVLKCAECTRELLELREQRNKQRGQVGVPEGALGMK